MPTMVPTVFAAADPPGTTTIASAISARIAKLRAVFTRNEGYDNRCAGQLGAHAGVAHPRVRNEAIVGRVGHRRVEGAVELDDAGVDVELVLVAAPLWDLDERGQLHVGHGERDYRLRDR